MAEQKSKLVFMGTPDFAVRVLEELLRWPGGEVRAVYTQPDRPRGRGRKCSPGPVKTLARAKGLPVRQAQNFNEQGEVERLRELAPDYLVVAAYGIILPPAVLAVPGGCALNVHASLLPKYRGAAPIQRAIMNGEPVTGITIMQMDAGMDTGDIVLQKSLAIGIEDTAQNLHDELAELGGRLLVQTLEMYARGEAKPVAQPEEAATYAPKIDKTEGFVHWDRPAKEIHNQIRGLFPWPGTYFFWSDQEIRLQVWPGQMGPHLPGTVPPGTFLGERDGGYVAVATRDREYWVPRIKPAGKQAMSGREFCCGYLGRYVKAEDRKISRLQKDMQD